MKWWVVLLYQPAQDGWTGVKTKSSSDIGGVSTITRAVVVAGTGNRFWPFGSHHHKDMGDRHIFRFRP